MQTEKGMVITAKAQNAGIAALEIAVQNTEKCIENVERHLYGDNLSLERRLNAARQAFDEAQKWASRAAGILHFTDVIEIDGPVFYDAEADRIKALREQTASHVTRLNDLFRAMSQSLWAGVRK